MWIRLTFLLKWRSCRQMISFVRYHHTKNFFMPFGTLFVRKAYISYCILVRAIDGFLMYNALVIIYIRIGVPNGFRIFQLV